MNSSRKHSYARLSTMQGDSRLSSLQVSRWTGRAGSRVRPQVWGEGGAKG